MLEDIFLFLCDTTNAIWNF